MGEEGRWRGMGMVYEWLGWYCAKQANAGLTKRHKVYLQSEFGVKKRPIKSWLRVLSQRLMYSIS